VGGASMRGCEVRSMEGLWLGVMMGVRVSLWLGASVQGMHWGALVAGVFQAGLLVVSPKRSCVGVYPGKFGKCLQRRASVWRYTYRKGRLWEGGVAGGCLPACKKEKRKGVEIFLVF